MTVTIVKHPDPTGPVLFPHVYSVPVCAGCYRRRTDLALTADPRVTTRGLTRVCGDCGTGQPTTPPTLDELLDLLTAWARWDINEEVDEDLVGRMLATFLPDLAETERDFWFGELKDALLWQQDVCTPGYDLAQHEPEVRDFEVLEGRAEARVNEALNTLTGGEQA